MSLYLFLSIISNDFSVPDGVEKNTSWFDTFEDVGVLFIRYEGSVKLLT